MTVNRYAALVGELEAKAGGDAPVLADVRSALRHCGSVRSYFVRPQTLFDSDSVYESFTCYVVAGSALIVVLSDVSYEFSPEGEVLTTVQVVPLRAVRDFQLLRRRALPDGGGEGDLSALSMRLRWGGAWAADTLPAGCDDPACAADHGTVSRISGDDVEILREPALDAETLARGTVFVEELQAILAEAVLG